MKIIVFLFSILFLASCATRGEFEIPDTSGMRWFKGNTHTHTLNSDGDSSPATVATWYKNHNYQFLVISDHDTLTDPTSLSGIDDSSFILIRGVEVSASNKNVASDSSYRSIHLNALGVSKTLKPIFDSTVVGTIQKNVNAIREANGLVHINHPNYRWSLNYQNLKEVENWNLLEIFNGHPQVNNWGGGGIPGTDSLWDALLSDGKRIFGIASDDAHNFKGKFSVVRSNPGRGYVSVLAHQLQAKEIISNLERGLFYASTGIEINKIDISARKIIIDINQWKHSKYRTEFIGENGKVFAISIVNPAQYTLAHKTSYVRAKIYSSNGKYAWIQPVFVH